MRDFTSTCNPMSPPCYAEQLFITLWLGSLGGQRLGYCAKFGGDQYSGQHLTSFVNDKDCLKILLLGMKLYLTVIMFYLIII